MSRQEFLRQLEKLLDDIPESERREALEYYRNYFEDAGPKKESQIIDELGSPQEAAESIKKNLFGETYGEYDFINESKETASPYQKTGKNTRNILAVLVIILSFPLWGGIAAVAFGTLISGIAVVFALAVAVFAAVGALFAAGFLLAGIGLGSIFTGGAAVGLALTAAGMFLLAFAILGLIALVWAVGFLLPRMLRAIVHICKKIFQKRGALI